MGKPKAATVNTDELDAIFELGAEVEKSSQNGNGGVTSGRPPNEEVVVFAEFTSMRLEFEVENLTTKMKMKKGATIQFCEFRERGFVLEVPPKQCATGHHLLIKIKTKGRTGGKELELEVTAKVDSSVTQDDGEVTVELTLLQYDEFKWRQFQDTFGNRQTEIEDFFKAAKGY